MLSMFKSIPTHMDYKGQKLAEQIFQGIILVSALTLPPWPMYRRNPLQWQPALPETPGETREKPQESQSQKKKKHK
ncbi:hypothetical protein DNTS_026167 [Danionella cerebrum]|uniref:Signal peptidase complex subunit 1 n=1 Tax=Danionella cerebrum TaxID=2873325 RepID=A0A553RHZ7_9TELE|nr:hypothetical protein DNTS_026167 [Danionella translucida]